MEWAVTKESRKCAVYHCLNLFALCEEMGWVVSPFCDLVRGVCLLCSAEGANDPIRLANEVEELAGLWLESCEELLTTGAVGECIFSRRASRGR